MWGAEQSQANRQSRNCRRCRLIATGGGVPASAAAHDADVYASVDPLEKNGDVCPCGFFAIHNRPLARPGKENLPVRMLVTVPITHTLNIIVCLICETAFKHHRHALRHMRLHHQHYHIHHNGAAVGGVERKL